ncbi:MAG TPA: hypothetical protein ENJ13_06315 [Chromatiales bacterium]|nr:hypothetical protein [Chromatiales bacterium]
MTEVTVVVIDVTPKRCRYSSAVGLTGCAAVLVAADLSTAGGGVLIVADGFPGTAEDSVAVAAADSDCSPLPSPCSR